MGAWCPPLMPLKATPTTTAALLEKDEVWVHRAHRHALGHHPRGVKSGLLRGILKKKACVKPKAQDLAKRTWFCKKRARLRPLISFRQFVSVTEFTREVNGGGTMPFDGTLLSLGLGRPTRLSSAPLAKSCPYEGPIEERAWVPLQQRVRLLRKAMGDARYFRAWSRSRREALRIKRSRRGSNEHNEDRQLMPTSLQEAQARALALAKEVKTAKRAEVSMIPSPSGKRYKLRRSLSAEALDKALLEDCLGRRCFRCLLVPGELGGGAAAGA